MDQAASAAWSCTYHPVFSETGRIRLMGMDLSPMLGVSEEALRSIRVPTVVIPGNDQTHSMACGRAIQRLIPQSRLLVPLEDQAVPLIPFSEWAAHEDTIARACAALINQPPPR